MTLLLKITLFYKEAFQHDNFLTMRICFAWRKSFEAAPCKGLSSLKYYFYFISV